MKKPKGPSHLEDASSVLQSLFQNSKSALSDQFLRWKVWRFWPEIVGEEISKHSEPVGFKNNELFLWVDSSARLQEIRFLVAEIKDKINHYTGRTWIKFIHLTLDRKSVPTREEVDPAVSKFLE